MRNIQDVLRLYFQANRSMREIADAVQVSPTTVGDYIRRAKQAKISWPLPAGMSDAQIDALLFPVVASSSVKRPEPDWAHINNELRRPHVTLDLLWREYKSEHLDGLQYSAFCLHYRAWVKKLKPTMRQHHAPGEKLFVDYSGNRPVLIDVDKGEVRPVELFVAVLGASNYTYAEASWTQSVADWIGSHERALKFYKGSPLVVVPDNLKSAVIAADFYSPTLNSSYREWAAHHGITIIPARVRRPRDKAKVEAGVLLAQRWILAALRNQRFFSLNELNEAIAQLVTTLNERRFKKMDGCRRSVFEATEQASLRPLPQQTYVFGVWMLRRVNIDYHVEINGHYYSVPYELVRQTVDARITAMTIELFHRGSRVASHPASSHKGKFTTQRAHMPPNHRVVAGWQPEVSLQQAQRIGPNTVGVIEVLLGRRNHMMQAYRSCTGVLRLATKYGQHRLEKACQYALSINNISTGAIVSILENKLDCKLEHDRLAAAQGNLPVEHSNVRGPNYYH